MHQEDKAFQVISILHWTIKTCIKLKGGCQSNGVLSRKKETNISSVE